MKLSDFALIFTGIMLPIMIIVYVNVSFTIKAQEQEIYYEKLVTSAVNDAASQMKEVESEDTTVDYGYSGTSNKKVSVNAQVGVDTFFKTMYNNFGISGNEAAERYLQLFVPAIAVIDYNGVRVSCIEEHNYTTTKAGESTSSALAHTLKPKVYYSYSYYITEDSGEYKINEGIPNDISSAKSVHTVEFTMDDYITHRGIEILGGTTEELSASSFYITDEKGKTILEDTPVFDMNNGVLVAGINGYNDLSVSEDSAKAKAFLKEVEQHLLKIRKEVIVNTVTKEIAYAVNQNNAYARAAGITYDFAFSTQPTEDMYDSIESVGMLAFVQGISVGNKYLNSKAYSLTKLDNVVKFYFSEPSSSSKYLYNLYHMDKKCPEYLASQHEGYVPEFVLTKQQAASANVVKKLNGVENSVSGFYPCPVCRP